MKFFRMRNFSMVQIFSIVKFWDLKFLKIRFSEFWNFERLKAGFEPINLWSQNINLVKNHISSSINLPKKFTKISQKFSNFGKNYKIVSDCVFQNFLTKILINFKKLFSPKIKLDFYLDWTLKRVRDDFVDSSLWWRHKKTQILF